MSSGPTSTTISAPLADDRRTVVDVPCLGCGCLCDDLAVTLDRGRVVAVGPECATGRAWFEAAETMSGLPEAAVNARTVPAAEATRRAVELLARARAPVVFGLTRTVTETVCAALELAEAVGARVVLNRSGSDRARVAAYQELGRVSATLGEVKNRADVVVFWGADPVATHPRHAERYSIDPKGRFVPEGRAGRTVIVVGGRETATSARADLSVRVPPEQEVETLAGLRMAVRGREPGNLAAGGADRAALEDLAARLKSARYGAFFYQGSQGWEGATRLVRDLNEYTRFVLLGMGGPGNLPGAEAALTWRTGFLQGVDFRTLTPAATDDVASLDALLCRREVDALLVVADDLPADLSEEARAHLATIPTVVVGPGATAGASPPPAVAIASAVAGFDAAGTVVRPDGVMLRTRLVRGPSLSGDEQRLRDILDGVRAATGNAP